MFPCCALEELCSLPLLRIIPNVQLYGQDGNTPLHALFFRGKRSKAIVDLLLARGGDPTVQNNVRLSYLSYLTSHLSPYSTRNALRIYAWNYLEIGGSHTAGPG